MSAAILALALAKVFVVAHVSGWRRDWGFAFLLGQLALLLALPGLFALWAARSAISAVSPSTVYAVWWLVAILVVVQAALAHRSRAAAEPKDEVEATLRGALSWMPWVSFALHLIGLGWVHRVPFSLAYVAPLVLALSAADILVELPWLKLKWQLPVVAIFLSLTAEPGLVPATLLGVPFSPARLMLVAAGLTYLLGWRLHRYRPFAIGAALCLGGPAVWMGLPMLWRAGAVMTDWLGGLMPQTTAQWGVLAVILAFALLGLVRWSASRAPGSRPADPLLRPPNDHDRHVVFPRPPLPKANAASKMASRIGGADAVALLHDAQPLLAEDRPVGAPLQDAVRAHHEQVARSGARGRGDKDLGQRPDDRPARGQLDHAVLAGKSSGGWWPALT